MKVIEIRKKSKSLYNIHAKGTLGSFDLVFNAFFCTKCNISRILLA
jgi:hypothetical protein